MATLLAPYSNGMRLGQGFNSYTQQICLDKAVLPNTAANRVRETASIAESYEGQDQPVDDEAPDSRLATVKENELDFYERQPPSWVKPQIVTYSSRFVDKISDVTDAMNISGSVAIKTATIGGKISGSYVDSDKFKSSDINFHLQVKVRNEVHEAPEYCIFNKIPSVEDKDFTNVYGDSFISGWETGGELNAIVSIKVLDKSKIFEVKASLEASLNQGAISGSVKGKVAIDKSTKESSTETTISVNWSGGGRIKNSSDAWTIENLKRAAAAFPDLVAITPQRTYAILTKYTALESFHRHAKKFSPLSYENAGVYTSSLLEHYMDYKSLWKQISNATYELEGNRASIEMARPSQDVYDLTRVRPLPTEQIRTQNKVINGVTKDDGARAGQLAILPSSNVTITPDPDDKRQSIIQFSVFPPTFAGLIQARQICRWQMASIVAEVDIVADDPDIASDGRRDLYFLNPLMFKQLLPVVHSMSAQDVILNVKNPNAALLLGYQKAEPDNRIVTQVHELERPLEEHNPKLIKSINDNSHKSASYRMIGCAGSIQSIHTQAEFFNDLDSLDATYRPRSLDVWKRDDRIVGLRITHTNNRSFSHGETRDSPTKSIMLRSDYETSEVITELQILTEQPNKEDAGTGRIGICAIRASTSLCNVLDSDKSSDIDEEEPKDAEGKKSEESAKEKEGSAAGSNNAQPEKSKPATVRIRSGEITCHSWTKVDTRQWSLRGFFGFFIKGRLESLGTIWGQDTFVPVPTIATRVPLARSYLDLGEAMKENVSGLMLTKPDFAESFYVGKSIQADAYNSSDKLFCGLDVLDQGWKIKSITFVTSKAKLLSGIQVEYNMGTTATYGTAPSTDLPNGWKAEVDKPLVGLKVCVDPSKQEDEDRGVIALESDSASTSSASAKARRGFINQIHVVPTNTTGWPLDVEAILYTGDTTALDSHQSRNLVEMAPAINRASWSLKGFYGSYSASRGEITQLGPIWGRD